MKSKAVKILVSIIVVLGSAVALPYFLNRVPPYVAAKRVLPSPNACDYYLDALAAMPEQKSQNDPTAKPWDVSVPLADKTKTVREYSRSLGLLREGFRYKYRAPQPASFSGSNGAAARQLARALATKVSVEIARKDYNKAMESTLDCVNLGTDVANGDLAAALSGFRVDAIAFKQAYEIIPHLNATEAHSAASRLQRILKRRVSVASVLLDERDSSISMLNAMASGPQDSPNAAKTFNNMISTIIGFKKGLRESILADYDAQMADANLPYSTIRKKIYPIHQFSTQISDLAKIFRYELAVDTARADLILLSLALRAYRLKKGAYPHSLIRLVPDYLRSIPDDPFGMSYVYKFKDGSYLLYSLGPDCKNDGGKPVATRWISVITPVGKHKMSVDTFGDIVAGADVPSSWYTRRDGGN